MNNFFLVAISFTLGYFCGISEGQAQTTYLYGAQGQSLGTVQQSGNTQYFYGAQGQSLGNAQQTGNTTYVYGGQGQSVGTVMAPVAPLVMPAYAPTQSLTPIYDSIFSR